LRPAARERALIEEHLMAFGELPSCNRRAA
jgi:hypothetical protein